jgi:septal ring factor EnvC (AmiA/AmiB activator)
MKVTHVKYLLLCLFTILIFDESMAQRKSRKRLEQEKRRNQAKIEENKRILEETKEKKETTVGKIKAIKEQISTQEQQISLIEQDLELLDTEILDVAAANGELEDKLNNLRKEYASMLYTTSKSSGKINKLSFLFSASSFNELIMRYKYLQQYTDNRKAQVTQINKVAALLKERQEQLISKKSNKQKAILTKEIEAQNLERLRSNQLEMVAELSKKEKDLRKEIDASKKSVKKLDNTIAALVAREIAKKNRELERKQDEEAKVAKLNADREERRAAAKATAPKSEKTVAVGNTFGASKNRLPWPVSSGFISDRFGVKEHPVLNGVLINNNGVDIQTPKNATVRAVYEGTVKDVTDIPGLGKVVAIQHGDYYTVYANLKETFVLTGQKVDGKETIGTAGESGGANEINFQIWHNTEKLNPEKWLLAR